MSIPATVAMKIRDEVVTILGLAATAAVAALQADVQHPDWRTIAVATVGAVVTWAQRQSAFAPSTVDDLVAKAATADPAIAPYAAALSELGTQLTQLAIQRALDSVTAAVQSVGGQPPAPLPPTATTIAPGTPPVPPPDTPTS